jgi:hypothetical protein
MVAALAWAGVLAAGASGAAFADEALSIDADALESNGCFGAASCALDGASVTATGGVLRKKVSSGATGFGVSGGPSGDEIDIGQNLRVDYAQARSILAIKIVFLYNGPEFGDKAEKAQVSADGVAYTLAVRNDADDAGATWSGPGSVTKCGATTASGTGCFVVTDPFPGVVSRLDFTAIAGAHAFPASGGAGTNESDYSIEFIDAGAAAVVDLENCASATGCPIAAGDGEVSASLNSLEVTNPSGPTAATVIPVRIPDCRYIPQVCLSLLPSSGAHASSDEAARSLLIKRRVIKPVGGAGSNRLHPAAELLNVTPLLPPEVTSLFDGSGVPPEGLPPMYIGSGWRGQAGNDYWIDGLFFATDAGVVFSETFEGLIDVSELTGHELGCVPDPGNLLAWDVITSVSERAKSVNGRHADRVLNVGCINPTKVSGERLSLYSVNLEVAPDTFGPTIKSASPKLTVANDAVFARLVQSLWKDLNLAKNRYACRASDTVTSGGTPPLDAATCQALTTLWKAANSKIRQCVDASFYPTSAHGAAACAAAESRVAAFEAALPAAATGPDAFNRLGELKSRVDVFQHVWDERFLNSLTPGGFCREKGTCPP